MVQLRTTESATDETLDCMPRISEKHYTDRLAQLRARESLRKATLDCRLLIVEPPLNKNKFQVAPN